MRSGFGFADSALAAAAPGSLDTVIVAELAALGIAQLKIQTASQLTKLQLIRISTERGKSQFVQVE